jgi:hypothetical protein
LKSCSLRRHGGRLRSQRRLRRHCGRKHVGRRSLENSP